VLIADCCLLMLDCGVLELVQDSDTKGSLTDDCNCDLHHRESFGRRPAQARSTCISNQQSAISTQRAAMFIISTQHAAMFLD
jgi:hypothetical protein